MKTIENKLKNASLEMGKITGEKLKQIKEEIKKELLEELKTELLDKYVIINNNKGNIELTLNINK